MSSWHSPGSIYNVGHAVLADFFNEPVHAEEKVDGSFFQFGVFKGELRVRSKGKEMVVDAPEKMFAKAVETAKELAPMLQDGWTYRCEYLEKPKHNVLAYDRTPAKYLILHDITIGEENFLDYDSKLAEAKRIGLEIVPKLWEGTLSTPDDLLNLLNNISVLGGQKIEGVVLKNYTKFGRDKKVLMAKYVSESFKEVHKQEWKTANPKGGDVLQILGSKYKSEARWNKAIQHLREAGQITDSPKDIGILIKEVNADVLKECTEEIKDELFKWAWPHISRAIVRELPQWYKEELVKKQFTKGDENVSDLLPDQQVL